MSGCSIRELGETIYRLSQTVEQHLRDEGQSSPNINDVASIDIGAIKTAQELAEAARELQILAQAPRQTLGMMGLGVHDASSLGVIVDFDIPSLVPLDGSATFAELAARSGLDEGRLTRIMRYAMLNFIFHEQPAGHVRHTALSAHLAQAPNFCDFLRTITHVFNPANTYLPIALRKWPDTRSMTESGHSVARGTNRAFYEWLDSSPSLRDNFDRGMEGISRGGQRLQDTDLRAYPWEKLLEKSVIVDMGGSGGHFARDLAELHPSLSIVVQDLPRVIETAMEKNHDSTTTRVTYQVHSFFDEQTVKGADVYFMRHVFHNHPDKECVEILKALLPALKSGARVLVSEYIVPSAEELSVGLPTKAMRQMDLMTMALFNAKERTKDEYSALFQQASSRLVLNVTYQIEDDARSCIFEAVYHA